MYIYNVYIYISVLYTHTLGESQRSRFRTPVPWRRNQWSCSIREMSTISEQSKHMHVKAFNPPFHTAADINVKPRDDGRFILARTTT